MIEVNRRTALKTGGAVAAMLTSSGLASAAPTGGSGGSDVFRHGVASGDPLPHRVLLWTRVTPEPAATPGSGRGRETRVDWEIATDQQFRHVAAHGSTTTGPWRDHTVKIDAAGLNPNTWYWYRFRANGAISPTGRTRTAPATGTAVPRLRVGVVSCANYQAGYFSAYRHLAARDDLDAVIHLGDYIYEYAPSEYQAGDELVRAHDPAVETTTLEHYRRRHAQYKSDPDLQALHARVPFIATWDDHEIANNTWSDGAENHDEDTEGPWEQRKRAASQAYAEWMPVRYEPGRPLYRRFTFGDLAELSMLDLRSHRSEQVSSPLSPGTTDPDRTITGDAQMDWLTDWLKHATAQWKLIGSSVMITPVRFPATLSIGERRGLAELTGTPLVQGLPYNVDQWDGYQADQAELFGVLRDWGIRDTVFLTGDIHSAWAADLPADLSRYPFNGNSIGTELVCTSITSDNMDDILRVPPRTASVAVEAAIRLNNPHIKHVELDSHGYSVLDITPERVHMDWFALADRTDPGSTAARSASFAVPAGSQRVTEAPEGLR